MSGWWTGTRLVFARGLIEKLRSKTFRVVTALLLVLAAGAVILSQVLTSQTPTYTLATIGPAPAAVVAGLNVAGAEGDFHVRYVIRDSADGLRRAVRDGDATVGLAGDTLYTAARNAGVFPAVVAQTVVGAEASRRLVEAGLSAQQIAALQSIQPPRQVSVAAASEEGRGALAFAVGIVLYLALLTAGAGIATAIATEKATRISEVLLAVLRPSQILVGTVLAVGTATLAQLLVLATPVVVAEQITDTSLLPPVASGDITLAIVWFLLGFALYAFLYAAAGALVDKVTEAGAATAPLTAALVLAYLISIFVVMDDPQGLWSVLASLFPLTAPWRCRCDGPPATSRSISSSSR